MGLQKQETSNGSTFPESRLAVTINSNFTPHYPSKATFRYLKALDMPLFEIETDSHIIITWAKDETAARAVLTDAYPNDDIVRITKRPRDSWVISKAILGATSRNLDICSIARDCLAKSSGDKLHAIRLYMSETGSDLEKARRIIESNMVMGW